MKSARELAAGVLDDVSAREHDAARGTFDGLDVEIRLVDRGVGSSRDPWTEIVVLGQAVRDDLHLGVIAQTDRDAKDVEEEQLGTDLVLDDPQFDPVFLVEAGPADVVKSLLDARVRKQMLALKPLGLHTRPEGLVLDKPSWLEDPKVVRALVILAVAITRRVPHAFEAPDRDARSRSAYRDGPSATSMGRSRRDEVADVKARKQLRDERNAQRGCYTVIAILAIVAILSMLSLIFAQE
ncbi:hypothetical protein [Sandaracinus amylolyticus]|uniref:Uncharacterized protein n=1 Tax=Sandaracinus amylolyticus TaxID=927083 RepID=A0A0F6SHP9_9BACT|nr:hypothetical protein [Sandaracinus amylolyticus]AKF10824.1 hypothetical protein DB32_007973 [Sandaracinus amylolyticus]